ncbi:hypothetical protein [Commensalibacter communis]|nr:hypothetical protein [Commensalibacter communis]
MCLDIINMHEDEDIVGLSITCIGHIARMYEKVNMALITSILENIQEK